MIPGMFGSLQRTAQGGPLGTTPAVLPPDVLQKQLSRATDPESQLPLGQGLPRTEVPTTDVPYEPSMMTAREYSPEEREAEGISPEEQAVYRADTLPAQDYASEVEEQGARLGETTQPMFLPETPQEIKDHLESLYKEQGLDPEKYRRSHQVASKPMVDEAAEGLFDMKKGFDQHLVEDWAGPDLQGTGKNARNWNELIGNAGIAPETIRDRGLGVVTGPLALAASKFAEKSVTQGQAKRADLTMEDTDRKFDPFSTSEERSVGKTYKPEKTFSQVTPAALEARNQNVLRSQLRDLGESFYNGVNRPPTSSGLYAPKKYNLSPQDEVTIAQTLMDQGLMKMGVDKKGRYFLFTTDAMNTQANSLKMMNHAYDWRSRAAHERTPEVLSQSFPEREGLPAGKMAMITSNMKVLNAHNIAATAVSIDNATPITLAPRASFISKWHQDIIRNGIYANFDNDGNIHYYDVLGRPTDPRKAPVFTPEDIPAIQKRYEDQESWKDSGGFEYQFAFTYSPFAQTLSKLHRNYEEFQAAIDYRFDKYKSEGMPFAEAFTKAHQDITTIQDSKVKIDGIHITKYFPTLASGPRFGHLSISPATARMFQQATDVNLQSHSHTIRMGFQFVPNEHQIAQFKPSNLKAEFHSIIDRALNALTSTHTGKHFGNDVHQKLLGLDKNTLIKAEVIYMIARGAEDHFGMTIVGDKSFNRDPVTVLRALKDHGHEFLYDMAGIGKDIINWETNPDAIPVTDEASPDWVRNNGGLSGFFKRKEWAYGTDAAKMAAQFVTVVNKGGAIPFNGYSEYDGRQSNAYIISNIIGDVDTARILGGQVDVSNLVDAPPMKDLRNRVAQNLSSDIDATFNGEDDAWIKEAIGKFFNDARELDGIGKGEFDKWYARGMVVAGLYGKAPNFMFTELDTMRLAAPRAFNELEKTYQQNGQKISGSSPDHYQDLGSLFATAMNNGMKDLMGYQRMLRSLGEMLAVTNGSTLIKTFLDLTIDIGDVRLKTADGDQNLVHYKMPDGSTLYANSPSIARDIHSSGQLRKGNIEGLEDTAESREYGDLIKERTYGEQTRNALPVDIIQSGDAAMMMLTMLLLQAGVGPDKLPRNMKSVHDAVIVPPGSVFLALNAMNNIAPFTIAEEGVDIIQNIYTNVLNGMSNMVARAKQEGSLNIGTEGDYPSLFGFFDRMFHNTYIRKSRSEAKGRGTDFKKKYFAESKETSKEILAQARKLGWLPPMERYRSDRDFVSVNANEVEQLLLLIQAGAGWLDNRAELPRGVSPGEKGRHPLSVTSNNTLWSVNSPKKDSIQRKNKLMLDGRKTQSGWGSNTH